MAIFLVKFVSKNYQGYIFSKYVVCNQKRGGVRYDACCLKLSSNVITETHIFLKFEFCSKPILKNPGTYLLKLATVAYTLNCNVSWIYKHKDYHQT